MWQGLVVFAPEAILDTLVRLNIINRLILGALIDSRSRVTSSRMSMEVGNYLVWCGSPIRAAQGILGLHVSARVRPILNYLALNLPGSPCIAVFAYVPKRKLVVVEDTRIQWSVRSSEFGSASEGLY